MFAPTNLILHLLLVPNTPQGNHSGKNARHESAPIRLVITRLTIQTLALVIRTQMTMAVVNAPVHQIEDICKDHRCQGKHAPVGREPLYAERFGNRAWKAAEQEAVCEPGETGEEEQVVGVGD